MAVLLESIDLKVIVYTYIHSNFQVSYISRKASLKGFSWLTFVDHTLFP